MIKFLKAIFFGIFTILLVCCHSAEKKEKTYLIIHSDDYGLSYSHNLATVEAIRNSLVNSTSIMMPCSWSRHAIQLMQENEDVEMDLGIHLTFTNEWEDYRWGPVSPFGEVPSLVNEDGFFYKDCSSFLKNADIKEVEKEMRAQIEMAIELGTNPTHLDGHMSCIFRGGSKFIAAYLRVAQEYQIPAMVHPLVLKKAIKSDPKLFEDIDLDFIPKLADVLIADENSYFKMGLAKLYEEIINDLEPGINVLLIHTAYDDEEMRIITSSQNTWHAPWRQEDFDFFFTSEAKEALKRNNVELITWGEIGEKLK